MNSVLILTLLIAQPRDFKARNAVSTPNLVLSLSTLRTQALEHIIDARQGESRRQIDHRHGDVLQTERAVARGAVEMCVLILHRAVAVVGANGIL